MPNKIISNDEFEAIIFDDNSILNATKYWTKERLSKAIPIGIELPGNDEEKKREGVESGTIKKADVNSSPYNAGGKLFFTNDGKDYVASAQFCEDSNLLLTAAHCIKDAKTGKWSENIVFKRGYNCSLYSQKVAIKACAIRQEWLSGSYGADFAFAVTKEKSEVQVLKSKINVNQSDYCLSFGYPGNFHSGEKMGYIETSLRSHTHNILCMPGNIMSNGCSGGAWLIKENNEFYVVSVNSFSYKNNVNDEYGPRFSDTFVSLLEYAKSLI